ncbi:MAG: tRNA (adenosine(37)-N6)-threonylcarbamoyltransferase complex dimerization subunit type 1 TsaB [Bacteroidales bacterium]|nr:tRNA (adenosine(37)-N6)-threonylcarbamoyltransferase complex dimerization subunit type 1 TsaB [Bacteroidales bacterium]
MSKFLLIESGTNVCSVAITIDQRIIGLKESTDEKAHATLLTVFIDQLIKETGIGIAQLDAIVISKGPGSYTGLRIGVSAAKGICYAAEKSLISICSLYSMSSGANILYRSIIEKNNIDLLCPMIDARRMEVYTALYNKSCTQVNDIEALVVDGTTFNNRLETNKILFFGSGSSKCKSVINHPNALFVDDFSPSAQFMVPLALQAFEKKSFENVAYFEPYYLKNFVATQSRKNIFPGSQ